MSPELQSEILRTFGPIPDLEENWGSLPDGPAWVWWLLAILPLDQRLQVILFSKSLSCPEYISSFIENINPDLKANRKYFFCETRL